MTDEDAGGRKPAPRKRSGRRSGLTVSPATILEAARREFATQGYSGTTMRSIGEAADVDPALIHHFFLSKGGLFLAAVQEVFSVAGIETLATAGPAERVGERVAQAYLEHWSDPGIRPRLTAVLRSTSSFEGAAAVAREFLSQTLLPLPTGLGRNRPEFRAALTGSYLLGVAAEHYLFSTAAIPAPVAARLAGNCQYYLYERL